MSQKSKLHRAQREAQQEKQAKNVIKWIAIAFVLIALGMILYNFAY